MVEAIDDEAVASLVNKETTTEGLAITTRTIASECYRHLGDLIFKFWKYYPEARGATATRKARN